MSEKSKVLAFDFGASSGRALLFTHDGKKLEIEEMHRFSNDPVMIGKNYHWDILRLFHEIKKGILNTVNAGHKDILAIGIDTWGVDFGLFDKAGKMISNPYHYRDERTNGMIELADETVGKKYIFDKTGIQFNFFNTLFQFMALKQGGDDTLSIAKKALFIPDIFNYFLTGVMKNEYTEASTSQLLDARNKSWDKELMDRFGLPTDIFCDIIMPGEVVGYLTDELCEELDCPKIPVIAVASHDTASAVASIPAANDNDYAYISSGTWALMGMESDEPKINDEIFNYDFTNEGGVCDKICFLKNIMGLWIVQENRRQWEREGNLLSFDELEKAAAASKPHSCFIDPDFEDFQTPGNMPNKIRKFCEQTGQFVPKIQGEIVRCSLESLALKCRMVLEALEDIHNKKINVIHMMGGGIKDKMFCSFVANATKRKVIAGPVEATGTGNAIVQLMALGKIGSLTEARDLVKNSFPISIYKPEGEEDWDKAYEDFKKIAKLN